MKGHAPYARIELGDRAPDAYAAKQRALNADYRREYEAWVASLSPEERRQLTDMGLDAPQMPDVAAGGHFDAADLATCAAPEDDTGSDDPDPTEHKASTVTPQPADMELMYDLARRLLGELLGQDNARLAQECLALVTGLAYDGDSMTEIAKRHGVTRAAVSKRCIEMSHALNLDPTRAMRSLKARESYRQSRNHQLREIP